MDFPIHIDTISIGLPIVFFNVPQVRIFLNYDIFLSLKIVLILANSVDTDEMQHYAAFHLGLHCLPKYQLGVSSIQRDKVLKLLSELSQTSMCLVKTVIFICANTKDFGSYRRYTRAPFKVMFL